MSSGSESFPSVSVVIPTLNSQRTLDACLASIRIQDYPQNKIEILIVDGGSSDQTRDIALAHAGRFIEGGYRGNQEARKSVGLFESKGEFIAYIDSDNLLPSPGWFDQMVRPFRQRPSVVASQTWRYGLKLGFKSFNRYCALLGASDPVAF